MSVALACTWRPRGEQPRLLQHLDHLAAVYEHLVVAVPPDHALAARALLSRLGGSRAEVVTPSHPALGRHTALAAAAAAATGHIHYADLDRLLRWVATGPEEWQQALERVGQADCLIIGRTRAAFATHPQALQQTEAIINAVFAATFGTLVDLGGGSRGFSARAARALLAYSPAGQVPERGYSTDAAWPILAQRLGFRVDYVTVNGLDWETADHYRSAVADTEVQRRAAEAYDADARQWSQRVRMALEIIQAGLDAGARSLEDTPHPQ
ncbi:MAG: hypothetical protein IT340_22265 [Chloroflexi bacterium]|nr:hypothetical protein [Chloroflexota bacterium]